MGGYTRDEALRAYTNVSTTDKNSTYSNNNSSYYPYSKSNKKKVYRPVINIDDIKVEKEEICDIEECESLEHIGIILREYKKFWKVWKNQNKDNHECEKDKDYEKNGFYAYFIDTISGDGEYTLSDV